MGNLNAIQTTILPKNSVGEKKIILNEAEIFEKILNISNDLFIQYNDEFLNEDFCSKLAFIYEKKLSNFNIKLLKSLHSNINSKDINEELKLTIQYIPKDNEKFTDLIEIFKESLKDNFWNKNIEINSDKLLVNESTLTKNNINSYIKNYFPVYYINSKHVNNLLKVVPNDVKIDVKTDVKIGGNNKELNNYFNSSTSNLKSTNNSKISNENVTQKSNINFDKEREIKSKKMDDQLKNINKLQKEILENKEKIKELTGHKVNINKTTNEIILKNSNIKIKEESIDEKVVNNLIKYTYPKEFELKSFCNNTEKCQLTKKELCIAITQNFIVRNNIIAAILTTLPYKNKNGVYEGGICYQKFLNLTHCKVCVPYDYRNLKNKDINEIIKQILEKSDSLDENTCRNNKGFFLKLTPKEKEILTKKALSPSQTKIKYNLFFIQFTEKLKNTYFNNLNSLILILEKMKNIPIINNKTLNLLGEETKNIIDNMYNLCHYYYIYAIISLINADITEDIIKEDKLEQIVTKALVK